MGGAPVRPCGRTRPTTTGPGSGRGTCRPRLRPWATGDVYLNFIGDEGEDRVAAVVRTHYQRLARVKAEHDPDNVFHVNHNIKPAPTVPTQR